jgi:V8-like Glu-specific endopeptidase
MSKQQHFLDRLPFDWTDPASQELVKLLSSNYYKEKDTLEVIQKTKVSPAQIDWNQPMDSVWHDITEAASKMGELRNVLAVIAAEPKAAGLKVRLRELLAASPVIEAPVINGSVGWVKEDQEQLERILGDKSTLLDISFLKKGVALAPSIARLTCTIGKLTYYGTGFVIQENTILTNHHVLFDWSQQEAKASRILVQFNYEMDANHQPMSTDDYEGDPATIRGVRQHDWAIITLSKPLPKTYPVIPLRANAAVEADDRVYIIQHPEGRPKQIGLHRNLVRMVNEDVVHYLTDTMAGSSGSPVFNENWELVALHHQWTRAGKEYRNEGIRIGRVIEGLQQLGIKI